MNKTTEEQIQSPPEREIIGHAPTCEARFREDTRHMFVFDVLTAKCPIGDVGDRVRIFLPEAGCSDVQALRRRGEIKIVSHAHVLRGKLYYDSQYEARL
jgi:hypothetical protein